MSSEERAIDAGRGGERSLDPPADRRFHLGVALLAALLLAPLLSYRVAVDQGVFLFLGGELLEGNWPYLDTWEGDYPGLMFLQALELALLGPSILAFRFFDWGVQIASALIVFNLTQRISGRAGGLVAVALFTLTYQGWGPWNTAQREGFGLFFALGGLWLYATRERRPPQLSAFAIGLGIGLGFLIKPTLFAFAPLYFPLALDVERKHLGRALRVVAWAAAGVALPTALTLGLYAALGGLDELWMACVTYQSVYTNVLSTGDPTLVVWWRNLRSIGGSSWVMAFTALALAFAGRELMLRRMLGLGYIAALFAVWVQGTFAGYHYLPGLGLGAILLGTAYSSVSAPTLTWLRGRWPGLPTPSPLVGAGLIVLAAIPLYVRSADVGRLLDGTFLGPPIEGEYSNYPDFDYRESWETARYLHEHTREDEAIQVWGYESLVYFLADRRAASRFQMTTPLVIRVPGEAPPFMQAGWRAEFMRDVEKNRPAYVVVVYDGGWWWAPEKKSSAALLEEFPEWRDFIRNNYQNEPDAVIGRFRIYQRRDRALDSMQGDDNVDA